MHMQEIEAKAKDFACARDELASRLNALREEQEGIKRRRLQGIRNALDRYIEAHGELRAAVESSPEQFEQPKTRILHGIKVGYVKQRGKLEFDDGEAVVRLIRKHLPDQIDVLVKVTETPVRAALANLSAADLKRLGVRVTDDVDAVVIKPVDGDVDKLVSALLNDDELEEARRA